MSKQTINIGASPNDGTGTPLRTSFDYCNQNFTEIYTALGGGVALPGATTQVIFNDGGTNLAGDAGLVYNKTTDALTVAGLVTAGSATITGDLTVRTTGLTVNSSGVGVGVTAALGAGNIQIGAGKYLGYSATAYLTPEDNVQGARIKANNILVDAASSTSFNIASSTAMTLNSTGLGIGVASASISAKLHIDGNLKINGATSEILMATGSERTISASGSSASTALTFKRWNSSSYVSDVVMDGSGNVGVGITPSAWATTTTIWRALDMQYSCGIASTGAGSGEIDFLWNAYYDQTDQRWEFKYTGDRASRYSIGGAGVHTWYNTASTGTANNPITWTQAMTLDASGRLGIGTASPNNTLTVRGTQDAGIEVNSADSNSSRLIFAYDPANTRWYINSTLSGSGTTLPLAFLIQNTEALRLNTTGNLVLKGGTIGATGVGVTFPATQVASSDANCLDDYEEGAWTPTSTSGSNLTSIVHLLAKYTKVGRVVTLSGYFSATVTTGSTLTSATLAGLPFAVTLAQTGSVYEDVTLKVGFAQANASDLNVFFAAGTALASGSKTFTYTITYQV